jgi:hypothetical protein
MGTAEALLLALRRREPTVPYQRCTTFAPCPQPEVVRHTFTVLDLFCAETLVEPVDHVILERISVVRLWRSLPNFARLRCGSAKRRWGVVQPVGHLTVNEDGEGSNPSAPANFSGFSGESSATNLWLLASRRPASPSNRHPWIPHWCSPFFADFRRQWRSENRRRSTGSVLRRYPERAARYLAR